MENKQIIILSFALSFIVTIAGALFKIMHWPFATALMYAGLAFSLLFIILSLKEISKSIALSSSEKLMWFIGFIFISHVAGLVYILSARNRIIRN